MNFKPSSSSLLLSMNFLTFFKVSKSLLEVRLILLAQISQNPFSLVLI